MNMNQTYPGSPEVPLKQENVARGLIGAFIGGLAGAAIAFALARVGFIASIAGFVGVFLAIKLYEKFAGGTSVKGVVIASVIALVFVLAEVYFDYSFQLMQTWNELAGKTSGAAKMTFGDAFVALPDLLKAKDVFVWGEWQLELVEGYNFMGAFIKDLLLSAFFAVLGSIALIVQSVKNVKAGSQAFGGNTGANIPSDINNQQNQDNSFDYDPNKFN